MGRQLCSAVGYLHRTGLAAPRPQARQPDRRRRAPQADRLQHRPAPRAGRVGDRHAPLDGARAGTRRAREREDRRLGHRAPCCAGPASNSRWPTTQRSARPWTTWLAGWRSGPWSARVRRASRRARARLRWPGDAASRTARRRPRRRAGRRPGSQRGGRCAEASRGQGPADGVRLVHRPRALRPPPRGAPCAIADLRRPRAGRQRGRRSARTRGRRRLLGHQRAGGGRRRARHRQDERHACVRRRRQRPAHRRRAGRDPGRGRHAEAGRQCRAHAAAARRPCARHLLALLRGRGPPAPGVGDDHAPDRGRRVGSRAAAPGQHARRRGRLRERAPHRRDREDRAARDAARPHGHRLDRAPRAFGQVAAPRCADPPAVRAQAHPSARRLPRGAPHTHLQRHRHDHRAHRRPRARPARGRRRRADDRRRHRLRVDRQPLRRHAALARPGRGRRRRAARGRQDGDPSLRRVPARHHRVQVERRGSRLPARPVGALRARGTPAGGKHHRALMVGRRRRRRERELRDRPARGRRAACAGRPRRRPRSRRADLRRALHRRRRFRGDVPAGRPSLHGRRRHADRAEGARRAQDPRLLGLPAPRRRGPAAGRGPGRDQPRPAARDPALAVRRLGSEQPDAPAPAHAGGGVERGRVRPSRVPPLAGDRSRRAARSSAGGAATSSSAPPRSASIAPASSTSPASPTRSRTSGGARSAARSSSATACSRSRRPACSRPRWTRWPVARGSRSRAETSPRPAHSGPAA